MQAIERRLKKLEQVYQDENAEPDYFEMIRPGPTRQFADSETYTFKPGPIRVLRFANYPGKAPNRLKR